MVRGTVDGIAPFRFGTNPRGLSPAAESESRGSAWFARVWAGDPVVHRRGHVVTLQVVLHDSIGCRVIG